jgi:hypothetical protein
MCWEGEIERVCARCMVALRRKWLAGSYEVKILEVVGSRRVVVGGVDEIFQFDGSY